MLGSPCVLLPARFDLWFLFSDTLVSIKCRRSQARELLAHLGDRIAAIELARRELIVARDDRIKGASVARRIEEVQPGGRPTPMVHG
jgi:hypothetical protein